MPTNPKEKNNKGGKRPGAGRKKGSKSFTTLEREKILEEWKNGVAKRTRGLLQAQTVLATGCIKVFVIRSHWEGSGKNKKLVKSKPEIVEDEEEIISALDFEYGQGDSPHTETEYYFVATKDPENNAINSLMDRTFGKAKEQVEVKHTGLTLRELHEQAKKLSDDDLEE